MFFEFFFVYAKISINALLYFSYAWQILKISVVILEFCEIRIVLFSTQKTEMYWILFQETISFSAWLSIVECNSLVACGKQITNITQSVHENQNKGWIVQAGICYTIENVIWWYYINHNSTIAVHSVPLLPNSNAIVTTTKNIKNPTKISRTHSIQAHFTYFRWNRRLSLISYNTFCRSFIFWIYNLDECIPDFLCCHSFISHFTFVVYFLWKIVYWILCANSLHIYPLTIIYFFGCTVCTIHV